jgi:AAA domain
LARIVNAFGIKSTTKEGSESFGIYGPAGSGKTRLATCAMRANPTRWGNKAAYIAVDRGGANLSSVLGEDISRLLVYMLGDEAGKPYDPYDETMKIADELRKDPQGCSTVILDTATVLARDILQGIANSGRFSDKHVMIVPSGPGKLAMAMPGDYGATQQSMFNIFRAFENLPLNFICLFHDGLVEPDIGDGFKPYGGPATAGKGAITPTAAWFDNLIRTECVQIGTGAGKVVKYLAHTEKNGPYIAKVRQKHLKNTISQVELQPDPINFWQIADEVIK